MRCCPGSARLHFQGSQPGEPPCSGASQPLRDGGKRTISGSCFVAFFLHFLFSALYWYNQSKYWSEQSLPVQAHSRKVPSSNPKNIHCFPEMSSPFATGAWPTLPSVPPLAAAELALKLLGFCCKETPWVKCSAKRKHGSFRCPPGFYFTGEGLLLVTGRSL